LFYKIYNERSSDKKGHTMGQASNKKEIKPYPIRHYVKMMIFILFSALVLDFIISAASISIVKQQSTRYLQDTANLYINRINHDFSYVNHYMGSTLATDENVKIMDRSDTKFVDFLKANKEVFKRFSELQDNLGHEYNFFIYLKDQDFFTNRAPMNILYPDYQALKKQIISYVQDKNLFEKYYSNWSIIFINQKYYIINIVPYYDRYMICLISADELIRPLRQINLGKNGFVSLVDKNGIDLFNPKSGNGRSQLQKDTDKTSLLNLALSRTTVSEDFSNASFSVKMVIEFGKFENIMIAQFLIILVVVIITCTLCIVMLYFKKQVLKPIQNFSDNLALLDGDSEILDLESSKIIELERANIQFKNLIQQIKNYKIDIYERELDKQRIQLDYMKLQIKPHFFLNCLTNIYSMAQMQLYEEIEDMAMSTSKYFRYIFQNGRDFVRLEDEISHVKIYLEIQQHRYRNAFTYRIEQAVDPSGMTIPPLVLQTFIENAVKYAVSRVNEVQILLVVDRLIIAEEEMTVIKISDTGPGFAADILEKLNNGQPLDQTDGNQIGIMNTLQRLELLYQQKANVRFSNREDGGACITIYIPYLPKEI
jgi:two-component system sensor histidine kinase YesM